MLIFTIGVAMTSDFPGPLCEPDEPAERHNRDQRVERVAEAGLRAGQGSVREQHRRDRERQQQAGPVSC